MNNENKKFLWSKILDAGDFLNGKLPDNPNHPKGRNSYAHVALEIRNRFKQSYKDLPDDELEKIIEYIKFIKNNPS